MRTYEEIERLMYSVAHRIKLNNEDASEMVQDAWLTGKPGACEAHQLSRTIANAMLDARRARNGRQGTQRLKQELDCVSLSSLSRDELEALCYTEQNTLEAKEIADNILNLLDNNGQMVVKFRIYKGMTYREISEKVGLTFQRCEQIYKESMKKMRSSKFIRELA